LNGSVTVLLFCKIKIRDRTSFLNAAIGTFVLHLAALGAHIELEVRLLKGALLELQAHMERNRLIFLMWHQQFGAEIDQAMSTSLPANKEELTSSPSRSGASHTSNGNGPRRGSRIRRSAKAQDWKEKRTIL